MRPPWIRFVARIRLPLAAVGLLLLLASPWIQGLSLLALPIFVVGVLLYLRVGVLRTEPVVVASPVRGSWFAVNSPERLVPSHGSCAYGQSHAVDLLRSPPSAPGESPRRALVEFPSFGQPVKAPFTGTVVRVYDRRPDHAARTSLLGMVLFFFEGIARELGGPSFLLGNHVIVRSDDHPEGEPVYAVMAHLRRRSVRVREGDRVELGTAIAECGNSGNSAEPHLHFQLCDHANLRIALGIPFAFAFDRDGTHHVGAPPTDVVIDLRAPSTTLRKNNARA